MTTRARKPVSKPSRQVPDPLATTEEVAAYLGKKPHTLENWRTRGYGPPPRYIGHDVRYDWSDVYEWCRQQSSRPSRRRTAA